MNCQEQLEEYLCNNNVTYQVQHHPQAFTAQSVAECEHIPGKKVAKSVIVFADGKEILLVLPATSRVDLKRVATCVGAQDVRLAREDEFRASFPNCEIGAMPPFGNLYNLPVCVEQSLSMQDSIVFPCGTHTETMSIAYADFERLVQPRKGDFALRPSPV
jgi:Ala-tRNA(Pro) deacylase